MKTNYEKKVDEIKNKPTLLLHRDDGGLVSMDGVVSTRQLIPFHSKAFKAFCQSGGK